MGFTQSWILGLVVIMCIAPRWARADVPHIDGHMTDSGHRLSHNDKAAVEEKLEGIHQDTHVDVAGWISDAAADDSLARLGERAYHQWNIGREWDNGVFLMISTAGRVRVVLDDKRPELTPAEVGQLQAADEPEAPLVQRVDLLVDAAGALVRRKSLRSRPRGRRSPALGLLYLGGAALLVLGAVRMGVRSRCT